MQSRILGLCCAVALALVPAAVDAATFRVPGGGTFQGAGGVLEQAMSNATPTAGRTDVILFDTSTAEAADTDLDIDFANAAYTDVTTGLHLQVRIARGTTAPLTLTGFQAAATATDGFDIFGGANGIVIEGFQFTFTAAVDFNDVASIRIGDTGGGASCVTVRRCDIAAPFRGGIGFLTGAAATNCDFLNCTANTMPETEADTGDAGTGFLFRGNGGSATNCEANGVACQGFRVEGSGNTLRNCTADTGLGTNGNRANGAFDIQGVNNLMVNCRTDSQAAFSGIFVAGDNNECDNCVATRAAVFGFNIAANGCTYKNCRAGGRTTLADLGNTVDGFFITATGCAFFNCRAIDNTDDGFDCFNNGFYKGCSATDNSDDGFTFVNNNNKMVSCRASGNTGQGFDLVGNQSLLQTCHSTLNGAEEFLVAGTNNFLDRCASPGVGSTFDEATDDGNTNIAVEIAADGNAGRSCTSGGTIDGEFRLRGN